MNFLDLNQDGKTNRVDGQIVLAFIFAAVGLLLLIAAFFFPPIATIDITIQSTAGMLFSFMSVLLGLDYHYSHKLQEAIASMQQKKEEEE